MQDQAVCFFLSVTETKLEQRVSSKQEKTAGASKLFRVVKSRQDCEKFTRETKVITKMAKETLP